MGKTLSEMSKELEHISENGSIGDLSEKMEEAEAAKVEVEAQLLERVRGNIYVFHSEIPF